MAKSLLPKFWPAARASWLKYLSIMGLSRGLQAGLQEPLRDREYLSFAPKVREFFSRGHPRASGDRDEIECKN